jgi:hypoxanthine phosphoribosyltransferase
MNKDIKKILIGEEELKAKVAELGAKITEDYKGKDLLIVCVLKGAVIFASDLIREINLPLDIDFMAISSYGNNTKSSGVVRILKDLNMGIILCIKVVNGTGQVLMIIAD